jgi:oligopeptide/dipeptide ABC transporter ATP-binding protein
MALSTVVENQVIGTTKETSQGKPLLKIEKLVKHFHIPGKGSLHAVDGISFDIMPNETLGLVGESGCGKSTVGNVLMNLLSATSGHVHFEGQDILSANKSQMHAIRKKIQIIFQDPFSSLNPRKTIREILAAPLKIHKLANGKEDLNRQVRELAQLAGLEPYVLDKFPHELDGGKRQMVGIARALALNPRFVVCDEPVSALDVSVQATIINLLMDLQKEKGLTYLFISHDLSVVRHISNRVAVMYLGEIVEIASKDSIFGNAMHPYTIALMSAVPQADFDENRRRIVLTGDVPSPLNPVGGCRFAPRCWMAQEQCKKSTPPLTEIENGHKVACFFAHQSKSKAKELLAKLASEAELTE